MQPYIFYNGAELHHHLVDSLMQFVK